MRGRIVKLIKSRGYGFIKTEKENDKEIFFHRSALVSAEFSILNEGDVCEFDITEGQKGPEARNIRIKSRFLRAT